MYAVSAAREIRQLDPIFFPFSSPDSSTAITSASDTPSACAASAGTEQLGQTGGALPPGGATVGVA